MVYSEADDTNLEELKVLTAAGEATYMIKKGDTLSAAIDKGDLINLGLVEGRLTQANTAELKDGATIGADLKLITSVDADKFEIKVEVSAAVPGNDGIDGIPGTGDDVAPIAAVYAYPEYYDETVFYVATFKADNSFDKWVLGDEYDARVNAYAVGYSVNTDGEKYVDDSNATINEVVFIVKSADAAKRVNL